MKKIITLIIISIATVSSQYKDVSKPIKECLKKESSIDFYGASLETNGTIHITVEYNPTWIMISRSEGRSLENILFFIDFKIIFKHARDIFSKVSEAKIIKLYFASFEEARDQYGNLKENKKKILMMLSLSKEKADHLNWEYVDHLVNKAFLVPQTKELLPFLDSFEFPDSTE